MALAPASSVEDRPLAAWRLTRHCAMSPQAYLRHVATVCLALLTIALGFTVSGCPIVAACLLVQVLALLGLHLLHAAHATDGERVALYRDRLEVVCFRGFTTRVHAFPTCWVRLEPGRGRDDGSYWICHGRSRLPLGRQVPLPQRHRVMAEIRRALLACRT